MHTSATMALIVIRLLRNAKPFYQAVQCSTQPLASVAESAPLPIKVWRVVGAVCVQRVPLLGRVKPEVQHRYDELREQLRMERSRLSDHELEGSEVLRRKKERDRRALEEELDEAQAAKLGGFEEFEELEESREAELASFNSTLRESEADREGDMQSPRRRMDRVLYLLVKKTREAHCWQMPQGVVGEGESLLEACQRGLAETCGPGFKVRLLSGAPLAHLSYRHPQSTAAVLGTKVFFLRGQWVEGEVQLEKGEGEGEGLEEHVWATREEVAGLVSREYFSAIAPMLTT